MSEAELSELSVQDAYRTCHGAARTRRAAGCGNRCAQASTRRERTFFQAYRPRADVRRLGFGTSGPTKVRLLHHPLDALQIKKKSCDFSQPIVSSGAGDRIRTYDHLITNQLLYRLSYASMSDMPLRPPIARCICVQAVSIRASSVGNDRLGRVIEGHPGRWHR